MKKERLASFKQALLDKQQQLADGVGRSATYGKDQEDDAIKDLGDQANTAYTREFFFGLGTGSRSSLRDVNAALGRIDDGSFGNCERCGEAIADKRLEAMPWARYCIDCQRLAEQEERATAG